MRIKSIKKHNKIIAESLFWIHIFIMIFAVFIGLFFSFFSVLVIIIVHRLHIFTFKECILFKLQRKIDTVPANITFPQFVSKKIFGKDINLQQSHLMDYGLVLACISVAWYF